MRVIKRNGKYEDVHYDKITRRFEKLVKPIDADSPYPQLNKELTSIDCTKITQMVCSGIYDGIKTEVLDEFAAEMTISKVIDNPDYKYLASRIEVSNLQKRTGTYLETTERLYEAGMVSENYYQAVVKNIDVLDTFIDNNMDYMYDYFAIKTLLAKYLFRDLYLLIDDDIVVRSHTDLIGTKYERLVKGFGKIGAKQLRNILNINEVKWKQVKKVVERPQHMLMRVFVGMYMDEGGEISEEHMENIRENIYLASRFYFTHASPTLFNSGTNKPQLASCFLLTMFDDSIEGIYKTLTDCAKISKLAGGIGVEVSSIRSKGSDISGGGETDGTTPMLRVFNDTAKYVNQSGKRKGAFAMYMEPWHDDIEEFLDLRKNYGLEDTRCRDLFTAMWVPDLFMQRVEADRPWSLMSPDECPGLVESYGSEFNSLYKRYEEAGMYRRQVKARELFNKILDSQIETGTPYMLYKDSVNRKSNQKNIGSIKSSNLCAEIVEYTSSEETAVCNLASISLPQFVVNNTVDHKMLFRVARVVCRNLNRVIDVNYYPDEMTRRSNLRHRPIGIGISGLADVFFKLKLPYESVEAGVLNKEIYETVYYGALWESMELARFSGKPYETFAGSPLSEGKFQFDLWGVEPSSRWNWLELRSLIMEHGVVNSLVTAQMPTATTAHILNCNESMEPITQNCYSRSTSSGEFTIVNEYLVRDLESEGLWTSELSERIRLGNGSVADIPGIPGWIKELYKTAWEIKQRRVIEMSAERGPFICQTQSLNLFMARPEHQKLRAAHLLGWKLGLKTGMYYLKQAGETTAKKVGAASVASASEKLPDFECDSCAA